VQRCLEPGIWASEMCIGFPPTYPSSRHWLYSAEKKNEFLHKYANQLGCQMPNWMRMNPLKKSNACIIDCGLLSVSVHPVTSILTSNKLFGTRGISTRSVWTNTKCKNNLTWIITSFATHINATADRSGVRCSPLSLPYEMHISWRETSVNKWVT